ncbi:MAG: hypothetical protein WC307_05600 [Candidatus Nanoarchaeia archaeon]
MSKEEIIEKYIGESDVNQFFDERKQEFEQYLIINTDEKSIKLNKRKLIKQIKDHNMRNLYNHNNLYFFVKKKDETIDRTLTRVKCIDKPYFVFKIDGDNNLFLYGKSRLFFTSIKQFKKDYNLKFEKQEKNIKEDFDTNKFIKSLLKLNQNKKIAVYEILFNSLNVLNKRIRCQFSSELKKDDVLELLSKEELKSIFLESLTLNLINSISFKDQEGNQETLKIREIEFGKTEFIWKRSKFSELRKTLSKLFNIYENKTIIFTSNGSLDNLFKEIEVTSYKKYKVYNKTLEEYSDYITIEKGKPKIDIKNLIKLFKKLLEEDYSIEEVNYVRSNKLIFPSFKSKKKKKELLRIKDKGTKTIVAYIYLNEKILYQNKNKFLRDFFIFMPCLIIDFRMKDNNDYYVSCSEFIKQLKDKNKDYFKKIISEDNKNLIEDVESDSFKDLMFVVLNDILSNFDQYNKKLTSQKKGELYEKMIFILFSTIFKLERLGGPSKHDGNIFIDNNTFIGYDAKNLSKNRLKSFIDKKTKKFKDRKYFKKFNIKHYFFIFENIKEEFFMSLVNKIKEDYDGEVYIKAFDINFIKDLFNEIKQKGLINYSRTEKQNLINKLLIEKDKIIK